MKWNTVILCFFVLLCTVPLSLAVESGQFTKLDNQGAELTFDTKEWVMVRDNTTDLVWEVKTTDGSIHDNQAGYNWDGAHAFIDRLNDMAFGGYTDWRLPTTDELQTIRVKGAEPYINLELFPNTVPTSYTSWRKCGSGEIFNERVKFGKTRNSKKNRLVRAVRGGKSQPAPAEKQAD